MQSVAEKHTHQRIQNQYMEQRIGRTLRATRLQQRISMGELAKAAGTSHQQIYKIEMGINRLSLSRFHTLTKYLKISPRSFYEQIFETGWELEFPFSKQECAKMLIFFKNLDPKDRIKVIEFMMSAHPSQYDV